MLPTVIIPFFHPLSLTDLDARREGEGLSAQKAARMRQTNVSHTVSPLRLQAPFRQRAILKAQPGKASLSSSMTEAPALGKAPHTLPPYRPEQTRHNWHYPLRAARQKSSSAPENLRNSCWGRDGLMSCRSVKQFPRFKTQFSSLFSENTEYTWTLHAVAKAKQASWQGKIIKTPTEFRGWLPLIFAVSDKAPRQH